MILGVFKILYNIPAAGLAAGAYRCARCDGRSRMPERGLEV